MPNQTLVRTSPSTPDQSAAAARTRGQAFAGNSLVEMLRFRAAVQPHDVAYVFLRDGEVPSAVLTWSDLDRQSRAIAARLQSTLAPGDRALLLYPPGLEFVAAFFGCLYANVLAVPVPLPQGGRSRRGRDRLNSIAHDCGPACVLTTTGGLASLGPDDRVDEPDERRWSSEWLATDALPDGSERGWRPARATRDSLAFLQYTSGSTASPKGVMVSHGNVLHNLHAAWQLGGTDERSVFVSWLPVTHDMGLIEGVLQPAFCGCPVYLMSPAAFLQRPARWLRAISTYCATRSGGPNFAYDLVTKRLGAADRQGLDLRSWRVAFNGSEPVRADTMQEFSDAFAASGFEAGAFRPCYGLAEGTLLVTTERWRSGQCGPVSCGTPPTGIRLRIVDPVTRRACPDGMAGEILVAGAGVTRGYWNRPAETADAYVEDVATRERWLRTGDQGVISGGRLVVTGRIKDLLIVRGAKHFPQDLEQTTERVHPALRRGAVAAVAVASGVRGDRIAIVGEIDPRRTTVDARTRLLEDIRVAIADAHGIQVAAVALVGPGGVPRTTSGKLQRYRCRDAWIAGTLALLACWRDNGRDGSTS